MQMNLFTKWKWIHRFQKQTHGYQRGNVVERAKLGAWVNIHILLYIK